MTSTIKQTTIREPRIDKLSTRLLSLTFTLILAALSPTAALAQQADDQSSVCVICNDPGKVYQCHFGTPVRQNGYTPDTTNTNLSNLNIKGLQFACIKEIAQYGAHGQCAANRKTAAECGGEIYQLKNTGAVEVKEAPLATESEIEPAQPPAKKPPTLVEETKKTYQKTTNSVQDGYDKTTNTVKKGYDKTKTTVKKTVNSVGETIGDAASTTYNCITSFFSNCSK